MDLIKKEVIDADDNQETYDGYQKFVQFLKMVKLNLDNIQATNYMLNFI